MTIVAEWLNTVWGNFDYVILSALHQLAEITHNWGTPFFLGFSFLAEKAILFTLLALILTLFRQTRKLGICILGSIAIGFLITHFGLKKAIARPRPFNLNSVYYHWWQFIGSPPQDGFSFPSGHLTVTTATVFSILLLAKNKLKWSGLILVALMGLSRCYLFHHFPSDVLGGILVGIIASLIAYFITKLIYYILTKYSNIRCFKFMVEFDLKNKETKN